RLPAACPSIIPKGNFLARQFTIFGVKGKASHMVVVQTNVILPGAKGRYPVIKGGNCHGHETTSLAALFYGPPWLFYGPPWLLYATKAWHPFLNIGPQPFRGVRAFKELLLELTLQRQGVW